MSRRVYSHEDMVIHDLADEIVEAVLVLPIGALAYVFDGWAGVAVMAVTWLAIAVARAWFRLNRSTEARP